MLKLPSGYGCDAGDATDERQAQSQQQQARASDAQYHNLPVAVPVSVPTLQRQRSLNGPGAAPARRKTAHQFSFRSLTGQEFIRLADFAGKVVLIVNVASHCNSTSKAYLQLNELASMFPDLVIIGCPCNQFGHQENLNGEEIYLSLKHIRPGKGFEPKFRLTEKVEVNGANAHPLFNFLRIALPYPCDRSLLDEMSTPSGVFSHPMRLIWMPVTRADVSWNFEKFLIGPDGTPYKRYSPKLDFKGLAEDVRFLSQIDVSNERGL